MVKMNGSGQVVVPFPAVVGQELEVTFEEPGGERRRIGKAVVTWTEKQNAEWGEEEWAIMFDFEIDPP